MYLEVQFGLIFCTFANVNAGNKPSLVQANKNILEYQGVAEELQKFNEKLREIQEGIRSATDEIQFVHYLHEEKKFRIQVYNFSMKYDQNLIKDPLVKRQFLLYTRVGQFLFADDTMKIFEKINELANKFFDQAYYKFQIELSKQRFAFQNKTQFMRGDAILQKQWKIHCETFTNNVSPLIEEYFRLIRKTASQAGFENELLNFWTSVKGYGIHLKGATLIKLWTEELNSHWRRLLTYFITEITDSGRGKIVPAYLYDMFNSGLFYHVTNPKPNLDTIISEQLRLTPDHNLKKIIEIAQEYYESLNFTSFDNILWNKSQFREIIFEGDPQITEKYINSRNYWIEVSAPLSYPTLYSVHRLLFKIHTNLLYEKIDLKWIFRESDFDPFYNALEAAVAMSVKSPKHAVKLGYIPDGFDTESFSLESLKIEALEIFTKLASSITMDSWKWDVLRGNVKENQKISNLWDRRLQYEGVHPLTREIRSLVQNTYSLIDCSSRNHLLPDDIGYLNFTEIILTYQIFASLCELAGQYDPYHPESKPLHECDISGRSDIGNFLKSRIISLGSSRSWPELLEIITGTQELNTQPLVNYFSPVFHYIELKGKNVNNFLIGKIFSSVWT